MPDTQSIALAKAQGVSGDDWVSAGTATLEQYFTGDVLTRQLEVLQRDAALFDQPQLLGDSEGVRNIVVRTISLSGDSATVTAQEELWSTSVTPSPFGRSPSETTSTAATYDWTFYLTRTTDKWLIDGESGGFAPGNGP